MRPASATGSPRTHPRSRANAAGWALAAIFVLGCRTAPAAELVLVVETDLEVPEALDRIEVSVGSGPFHRLDLASADPLPATLTLLAGGSGEQVVALEVRGYLGDTLVVTERASAAFVPGEARALVVWLLRACRDPGRPCPESEGCAPAGCIPRMRGAADLPVWDPSYATARLDGGPPLIEQDAAVCEPRAEVCNGADDDCDGVVDESVDNPDVGDAEVDSPHCGRCFNECPEPNCFEGTCNGLRGAEAGPGTSCVVPNVNVVRCRGALGPGTTHDLSRFVSSAALLEIGTEVTVDEAPLACISLESTVSCHGGIYGPYDATPAVIPVGIGVRALAVGAAHACAVRAGGVSCWGQGSEGQLGPTPPSQPTDVVQLAILDDVRSLTAGAYSGCAVVTGGEVRCWGRNECGQLGRGSAGGQAPLPMPVLLDGGDRLTGMRQVACAGGSPAGVPTCADGANAHCCAIDAEGETYCWGSNAQNQVTRVNVAAVNAATHVPRPTEMGPAVAVAVAMGASCVVTLAPDDERTHEVWCWGDREGHLVPLSVFPTRAAIPDGTAIRTLALSPGRLRPGISPPEWGMHALVTTWDGRVLCWGDRTDDVCGEAGTAPTEVEEWAWDVP